MSDCALELGDLKPGMLLGGLVKDQVVTIASVDVVGDVATLIYRLPDGSLRDEMIDASVLRQVHVVEADQAGPALDADPEEFRMAAEALRIKYAALYDPMAAVYSSVEKCAKSDSSSNKYCTEVNTPFTSSGILGCSTRASAVRVIS